MLWDAKSGFKGRQNTEEKSTDGYWTEGDQTWLIEFPDQKQFPDWNSSDWKQLETSKNTEGKHPTSLLCFYSFLNIHL